MVCWTDFNHRRKLKETSIKLNRTNISDEYDYDTADALPKKLSYTWLDILVILISVCSFILDTASDVFLSYIHYTRYKTGDTVYLIYFILTLLFVLVPTLTMTVFSLKWYMIDNKYTKKKVPAIQWILRTIFLFFQLGPVLRYIDSLLLGIKSQKYKCKLKQREYFQEMLYEDVDAALLRLFESFMEAVPQLLLQIYILLKMESIMDEISWKVIIQISSVFISLVSISWAITAYFRALRFSLPYKKNMGWISTTFHYLWHFFDISARVLALSLFASVLPEYLALVCSLHWFIMAVWIITLKTQFCTNRYEEILYNAVVGVIFIFCYFNPIDTPTRRRYIFYYFVIFMENTILLLMWYYYGNFHFRIIVLSVHYCSFFIGITFMVIYYLYFHPTRNIKICENWSNTNIKNSNQNSLVNKEQHNIRL